MVIRMGAGDVGPSVSQLVKDVRSMMEPDTASRLKERKSNKLKDYLVMAGPLGVTHLILFSRSESGNVNMRIALAPRGPTLNFRVEKYSLIKDIAKSQKHPRGGGKEYHHAPLLVMNNSTTPEPADGKSDPIRKQLESLTTTIFQSMFPPISPQNTPLSTIRRIMLVNREPSRDGSWVLNVRHYAIITKRTGASRRVRRLDPKEQRQREKKGKAIPNLGKLDDAADYLLDPSAAGYTSASETELDTDNEVEVLETATRRVLSKKEMQRQKEKATGDGAERPVITHTTTSHTEKRAVKLVELGPRLRLRMYKVEEGVCDGRIMWHDFVTKSKKEKKELDAVWEKRRKEKEERRKAQKENVERKKKEKEEQRKKSKGDVGDEGDDEDMDDDEVDDLLDDDAWDSEDYDRDEEVQQEAEGEMEE